MTTSVSGIGASGAVYPGDNSLPGTTVVSPDLLLAYCQIQLGSLDDQVTSQMNSQQLELSQRTAVQNVETTLESFGDTGPSKGEQMHTCVVAFQNAIASLPAGDPVAAQLQAQETQMIQQYGYQEVDPAPPPQTLVSMTPATTVGVSAVGAKATANGPDLPAPQTTPAGPSYTIGKEPANDDWKGTTDAVGNLADDIKSNSEIQMLTLQDLVSQRQQVVELATGMMSKEDDTLTDGAKAIGQ